MWKPASVVPEHRTRATVIWGALLLAIAGYTTWQIAKLHRKFDNPSTRFSVSDDVYAFPIVNVCVWGGIGCDESREDSTCIGSAGFSVYDPCQDLVEDTQIPSEWTNCLAFDLSTGDMQSFVDNDCGVSKKPATTVMVLGEIWSFSSKEHQKQSAHLYRRISWITSFAPEEEKNFREVVYVFLGNESPPEYVAVPYSRIVSTPGITQNDAKYIEADLTIGRSTRNYIGGNSTTSYPVLSISTGDYVDQTPNEPVSFTSSGGAYAVGYLHLTLTQGGYSLTELTDINPLDIGNLLGNIGGFWELLLVVWGLCFVAVLAQSPTEKSRDFNRPIQKGKELISRKRRRVSTQASTPDLEDGGEEQPYWSAVGRGRQEAPDGGILVTPPNGARTSTNVKASFFRRPIPRDCPMRLVDNSSRLILTGDSFMVNGGEESKSQQYPPPL